LNQILFFSAV